VGLRAGLDLCGKSPTPLGFGPLTVQAVASRYTDRGIWRNLRVKTLETEIPTEAASFCSYF
jgi:hypothetical protein